MINSGIYQLLIEWPRTRILTVGNLGEIMFSKGLYIYTGSAKVNLRERISRHFKKEKRFHWHIDYLLEFGEIIAYNLRGYNPGIECKTNIDTYNSTSSAEFIPGFGCSDCRCKSHLIFIPPG